MGGKNAGIVFDDVDLESDAEGSLVKTLTKSCFINQGEVCLCTSRLYVHASVYERFVERFVSAVK
jgi:acyl-CoA reductase-like NAD-dependent aldehyde dehydrogenase